MAKKKKKLPPPPDASDTIPSLEDRGGLSVEDWKRRCAERGSAEEFFGSFGAYAGDGMPLAEGEWAKKLGPPGKFVGDNAEARAIMAANPPPSKRPSADPGKK